MYILYTMREFRVDLPRESATEIVEFLHSLNSDGWLISFEKGLVTSKDHWQGWVDTSPSLASDYQLKKLKDFAISKGLTKGHYAFPIVNDGDKWFSYICKHKSKDIIEVHHSYSSEDLEAKYKQASEWLSKEEYKKEQKKIPFLRRCIEVACEEALFKHPDKDFYILRYDIIRKIMYRMFNANEKGYDMFSLQKHCNGVANYFEEMYGYRLLQNRRSQRILGLELTDQTIGQLYAEADPRILELQKEYILYNPNAPSQSSNDRNPQETPDD